MVILTQWILAPLAGTTVVIDTCESDFDTNLNVRMDGSSTWNARDDTGPCGTRTVIAQTFASGSHSIKVGMHSSVWYGSYVLRYWCHTTWPTSSSTDSDLCGRSATWSDPSWYDGQTSISLPGHDKSSQPFILRPMSWNNLPSAAVDDFTIDTDGSTFDTVMGLYYTDFRSCGSWVSTNEWTEIDWNDDGGSGLQSSITVAGSTIQDKIIIAVVQPYSGNFAGNTLQISTSCTILCSSGRFLSNGVCTVCAAGQYQPTSYTTPPSASSCISCPAGQYDSSGRTYCISCATDQTSPAGSDSSYDCYTGGCAGGQYLSGTTCENCGAGQYQSLTTHSLTSCSDCPAGQYSEQEQHRASCIACPTGTTSVAGSDADSDCMTVCASGEYFVASYVMPRVVVTTGVSVTAGVVIGSESFEASSWDSGGDLFTQDTATLDWTRTSSGTPSSDTGAAAAYDGTYYVFTEASSQFNMEFILDFNPTVSANAGHVIEFWYHMYGSGMGVLSLEMADVGSTGWMVLWSQSGGVQTAESADWVQAVVAFTPTADSRLIFRGVTGSTFESDICIDKVELQLGDPPAMQMTMGGSSYNVDTRIAGGLSRGVLEVNVDNQGWGAVCDDGFNTGRSAQADAFCGTLGFSGSVHTSYDTTHSDNSFAMDDVQCHVGATIIQGCTSQAPYSHNCGDHETVGIGCDDGSAQGTCHACEPGQYQSDGSHRHRACAPCPLGSQLPTSGATTGSDCLLCAAGSYGTASRTACTDCSVGQYSAWTGATGCTACPLGAVSVTGQSSCTVCPEGSFATDTTGDVDGVGVTIGASTCNSCPQGTFRGPDMCALPGSGSDAQALGVGCTSTWSSADQAEVCTADRWTADGYECALGTCDYFSNNSTGHQPTAGVDYGTLGEFYSGTWRMPFANATANADFCTMCSDACAQDAACERVVCITHPHSDEGYCEWVRPTLCDAGELNGSNPWSESGYIAHTCSSVAPDRNVAGLPVGIAGARTACAHTCQSCGRGHFTAASTSDTDGTGVDTGAAACNACPAGTENFLGDSICDGCGAGSYTDSAGCHQCNPGFFNAQADPTCEGCAAGMFADQPGQPSCHACGDRCHGQMRTADGTSTCATDGSCVCEDVGFSGDLCQIFTPSAVFSDECAEHHPAAICVAGAACVSADLPTPAWTDDSPDTPEQQYGHPTTPAAEYMVLATVCEAGLPIVVERTARWLQLAEDYMLQTATGNAAVITLELCKERRFQTLACLVSPMSVGNLTQARTQTVISSQLNQLKELHKQSCGLRDVIVKSERTSSLLQTADVRPLSFQQYETTVGDVVAYVEDLEAGLTDVTTTAIDALIERLEQSAETDALDQSQEWQKKIDGDSANMQAYRTQVQGLHARITEKLRALQLDGPALIDAATNQSASARQTFDAALGEATMSREERDTAAAKLDRILLSQTSIENTLQVMRSESAARQTQLRNQLAAMEANDVARHAEVTHQLDSMEQADQARQEALMGELAQLHEGQSRIQDALARSGGNEPSTCDAGHQLSHPPQNGCGNSLTSMYHDAAQKAVQKTGWFGSGVNFLSRATTGYSADGADGLVECCNDHDVCYGLCGHTQGFCDRELSDCMQDATSLPTAIPVSKIPGIGTALATVSQVVTGSTDLDLLNVDSLLQEFLGCGCFLQAQVDHVADHVRGTQAMCAESRVDVILRKANDLCDVVLGVAASLISGEALEFRGVDVVSNARQARMGRAIRTLVNGLKRIIRGIQRGISVALKQQCIELTAGRRLSEQDRAVICVDLDTAACDQLLKSIEDTNAKVASSMAFVDTASALVALNTQLLTPGEINATTVAQVDMRMLDLETMDDEIFVNSFRAAVSKTADFAEYEMDVRQVVSLLRSKMEQMRKFYEAALSKESNEQQRSIHIRRAQQARQRVIALQEDAAQRQEVHQALDANIKAYDRIALSYLLQQVRAYEYVFLTDYSAFSLDVLQSHRKTGSEYLNFIQEQAAALSTAFTDTAAQYTHCGSTCASYTQFNLAELPAERQKFVQSGELTFTIKQPLSSRLYGVTWVDMRVFLIGLDDRVVLNIWQSGTSVFQDPSGKYRRFTHAASSDDAVAGWTNPPLGFSYDGGQSCLPLNNVRPGTFSCSVDAASMYVRSSPYSTWTVRLENAATYPLQNVRAVRFEFNLAYAGGNFAGQSTFFTDSGGSRGCEGADWGAFTTEHSCSAVWRICAPLLTAPTGYQVVNTNATTVPALGSVACAHNAHGLAHVEDCTAPGGAFVLSGCQLKVTGKCAGNFDPAEDFVCGTGFSLAIGGASITTNGVPTQQLSSTCCTRTFCKPADCSGGYRLKDYAETTLPPTGVAASSSQCCRPGVAPTTGRCVGNADSGGEPDVVCTHPSQLRPNASTTDGREISSCCITNGMCKGNTLRTEDVQCGSDAVLVPGAFMTAGTSTAACCDSTDTAACATQNCTQPAANACKRGGFCVGGVCQPVEDLPDQSPCDDLNPLTSQDECTASICAGVTTLTSSLTFNVDAAGIPSPGSTERTTLENDIKSAIWGAITLAGMASVTTDDITIVSIGAGSVVVDYNLRVPPEEATESIRERATARFALSPVSVNIGGQIAQLSDAAIRPFTSMTWVKTTGACDSQATCGSIVPDVYTCYEDGSAQTSDVCLALLGPRPGSFSECRCDAAGSVLSAPAPPHIDPTPPTPGPLPEPSDQLSADDVPVAIIAGGLAGITLIVFVCCCMVCYIRRRRRKGSELKKNSSITYGAGVSQLQPATPDNQEIQMMQDQMQSMQQQIQIQAVRGQHEYHAPDGSGQNTLSTVAFQSSPVRPAGATAMASAVATGAARQAQLMKASPVASPVAIHLVAAGVQDTAAADYAKLLSEDGFDTVELFNQLSIDDLRNDFGFKRGHIMAIERSRPRVTDPTGVDIQLPQMQRQHSTGGSDGSESLVPRPACAPSPPPPAPAPGPAPAPAQHQTGSPLQAMPHTRRPRLIAHGSPPTAAPPSKAELQGLTVGELRKRAAAAGVDSYKIEQARDGEAPRADIVQLILAVQAVRPSPGAFEAP